MASFQEVYSINVNDKVEKKDGLSYLSWAYAWAEFKKIYPEAIYEIKRFDGKPYIYDENLGYMVFTSVTAESLTYEMWLPVMDGKNKAMKSESYTYTTKYGEKTVEAATMFDVNKTIMRCLVKNLAMFGLGLYIYAGEDLPEEAKEPFAMTDEMVLTLRALLQEMAGKSNLVFEDMLNELLKEYKVDGLEKLDEARYVHLLNRLKKTLQ